MPGLAPRPPRRPPPSSGLIASLQVISMRRRPVKFRVLLAAVIALVTAAAIAFSLIGGPVPAAPHSSGTVVNVSLTDSGGPMGEGTGPMHPGAMGLKANPVTVPHGTVTFRVTNAGAVNHEMVILPLGASQVVGTRPFDGDAKVDEAGSLGEASKSDGDGAGEGIVPGSSGRVTVTLAPGQYELVCNIMGHYVSGMYGKLTVT